MKVNIRIDERNMGEWDGLDVQASMYRYCKSVNDEMTRLYPDDSFDVEWGEAANQSRNIWFDGDIIVGGEADYELTLIHQDEILDDVQLVMEQIFATQLWPVVE